MPAPPPPSPSPWNFDALRLPRSLEAAQSAALHAQLQGSCRDLWEGGVTRIPNVNWTDALAAALRSARKAGNLLQGLEQAERALMREARGLSMADARAPTERGSRVSRLLLASNDGTERFYRQVERLLRLQGARLLALRLDVDSARLGGIMGAPEGRARALLVEHKTSVATVLVSLLATSPLVDTP